MEYKTILIKNGNLLDVETGNIEKKDILIIDGTVKQIETNICASADKTIDAQDMYITPGWVDAHAHVFSKDDMLGVSPDENHLQKGVTCVVDPGSSGSDNYNVLREDIFAKVKTLCYGFLNCSRTGIHIESLSGAGELSDESLFDENSLIEVYNKYRDELLGIKIRLTPNVCPKNGYELLKKASLVSAKLSVPLEVHPNFAEMKCEELFGQLKKNDIYTHMYHDSPVGILDENGKIKDCVLEARKRGVIFDVAHGVSSMSFKVMKKALEQGFEPDMISTDLHNANVNGPVYDLATTISKFLCAGMPLEKAIYKVTKAPVEILNIRNKSYKIEVGQKADITGFVIDSNEHKYTDACNYVLKGNYKVITKFTVLKNDFYDACLFWQ